MCFKLHKWLGTAAILLPLLALGEGGAEEREHFQLKIGPTYDQGDFGMPNTTRTFFLPVTLRYLGERLDFGVTGSLVVVDTVGGVSFLDGIPTRTAGAGTRRTTEAGVGDTLLKGRFFLLDDPGPRSPLPALTPFAKIKIPTADETRNLGTGETDYGFGVELDKQFGDLFLFADVSYTVIGNPPGQHFRDRPAASFGAGMRLSNAVTVSALIDWRRAIVSGNADPVELVGILTYKVSRVLTVSPNVSVGLSNGSPDFGVGVELAYKFGRY